MGLPLEEEKPEGSEPSKPEKNVGGERGGDRTA